MKDLHVIRKMSETRPEFLISCINFSNGSINFEHTIQNPSNPKEAYLVGLKNISIYNNYNKIKSFDFIYDDLMKTRKLLRNGMKTLI